VSFCFISFERKCPGEYFRVPARRLLGVVRMRFSFAWHSSLAEGSKIHRHCHAICEWLEPLLSASGAKHETVKLILRECYFTESNILFRQAQEALVYYINFHNTNTHRYLLNRTLFKCCYLDRLCHEWFWWGGEWISLKSCNINTIAVFPFILLRNGARGNVVVKTLCYKPEGRGFETRWSKLIFSIYLILSAALGPGGLLSL
jgi:hypothetical protein